MRGENATVLIIGICSISDNNADFYYHYFALSVSILCFSKYNAYCSDKLILGWQQVLIRG
jgi:hypothetical protein